MTDLSTTTAPGHRRRPARTAPSERWMVSFVGFPMGGAAPSCSSARSTTSAPPSPVASSPEPSSAPSRRGRWVEPAPRATVDLATALGLMVGLGRRRGCRRLPDRAGRPGPPGRHLRLRCRHRPGRGARPRLGRRRWPGRPPSPPSGPSAGRSPRIGIRVDEQFTVFGSSGALVATALTAVLPLVLTATKAEQVMTRHVVFGTGQVGRLIVEQLVAQGHDVVAVNRSGRPASPAHRSSPETPPTRLHHARLRRRRRRLLLPQRRQLRPLGRRVPAPAAGVLTGAAHRRRPPRRPRQPLRLRAPPRPALVETMPAARPPRRPPPAPR